MVVATARFHMDRCNNQMNLSEFFQRYHNALSDSFSKLSNATNLRNSYNNNASKATVGRVRGVIRDDCEALGLVFVVPPTGSPRRAPNEAPH